MKELTVWDNNPRMMWVWNDNEKAKRKQFVIYIKKGNYPYKVIALDESEVSGTFGHCADIESSEDQENNPGLLGVIPELIVADILAIVSFAILLPFLVIGLLLIPISLIKKRRKSDGSN